MRTTSTCSAPARCAFALAALAAIISAPAANAVDVGGIVNQAVRGAKVVADQASESQATAGTDALVKRADTELRAAERKMFSGDKEAAQQQLDSAGGLIAQIEAAEPGRKELAALKQKQSRVQADLDRRMGKPAGAASKAPTATEQPAAAPAAAEASSPAARTIAPPPAAPAPAARAARPAALPYHAREKMAEFDNRFRSVEYALGKMEEARKGDTTTPPEKYAAEVGEAIPALTSLLDEARTEAASAGVAAHPAFEEAQRRLDALPGRLKETQTTVAAAQEARAASSAEIAADVEKLTRECDRLDEKVFNKASGATIYYNDLAPVKEQLDAIVAFEKEDLAQANALLESFSAKYGATDEEIRKRIDDPAAARTFANLKEGIANVAKTRTAMAEDLAARTAQRIQGMDNAHDFSRLERHAEARAWMKMAQDFDAGNAKVKELAASLEQQLEADAKKLDGKIAGRKWPGNAANAPDDAGKLAATALEYFRNSIDWGRRDQNAEAKDTQPRVPLAVAVTGPWSVQARNIVGEPTMYGLPILLAVQVPAEKDRDLARVFVLTMRTSEERNVKMEPPFESVTVGDSYYMRASAVK